MDIGKYIDFAEDQKEKNTIWHLVDRGDGVAKIQQEVLEWAIQGDSDSIWMKFPENVLSENGIDELVRCADVVCENVNSEYPEFLEMVFNSPEYRRKEAQSTREVVCSSMLILTKKRYIARIIDEEGKRYDPHKMKIMGVEIKKANTSNMTKKFLMELVNMILDGHTIHEVKNRINQMKEEFMQSDVKDIATTMNAKKIKSATDTYNLTGSMKGIHYASKAALVYNLRCTNMDRKVVPGDKVSLYYTLGKESAMAFPSDLNTLPDWLLEIPVDYDKMWSKCHKTITNYLKAMDWDIESRKEAIGLELFGLEKVEKTKRRKK